MSIKNDGHYFCGAGGNRPDGSDELGYEEAEVLRFDNFDDAVECCADLNIPFFVDAGNKKLVFWFVRVDDEGYPEIARCMEREFATIPAWYQRRRHVLP
ncbi:hypothetical protein K3392_24520 (plasmid) [Escherichia coli]|nr:hypothetical protein K3392_24520 [Escherichia coli]